MHELQAQVVNATLNSREVASMMEIDHSKLLRKLDGDKTHAGIIPVLTEAQMGVSEYFIESSYIDGSGKENRCYEVTKKGCEMLAHKLTGEKGIIFTAKYIERFHTMEDYIKSNMFDNPAIATFEAAVLEKVNEITLDLRNDIEELKQQAVFNHRPSHATKLSWNKVIKNYAKCKEDIESIKDLVFAEFGISKWEDLPANNFLDVYAYIRKIAEKSEMITQLQLDINE